MRAAYEREEKLNDTEVTLGMTSLLGIFFGLVLVCGIFFGFGYSMGRHKSGPAAAGIDQVASSSAQKPPATPAIEDLESTPPESEGELKPRLESAAKAAPLKPPAARVLNVTEPVTKPAAIASLIAPQSGGVSSMVQVAAVSHQEDAEALVAALRKRGYSASVHSVPQDKLLRVQVGPLASRDEAKVIKARLQADGYNAIIKP